MSSKTEHSG